MSAVKKPHVLSIEEVKEAIKKYFKFMEHVDSIKGEFRLSHIINDTMGLKGWDWNGLTEDYVSYFVTEVITLQNRYISVDSDTDEFTDFFIYIDASNPVTRRIS